MKKILSAIILFAAMAVGCLTVCGCEGSLSIKKPEITSFGNVIYWDEVEGADSYVVDFGEEKKDIFTTYYIADNLTTATQVSVRTKVGENVSQKSNAVTLTKTDGFTEEETYNLALADGKTYDILPSQNLVKISGSAVNSQIKIQNRSRDLVIELNDVTISASQRNSCISTHDGKYDSSETNFTVIFIVNGENKINGSDYSSTPAKQSENSGKNGTRGGNGGNGIVLPNVVFSGNGVLTVNGGKGGNGGDGANSSGMSTSCNGSGGNGGNGGSGLLCTDFVVAMKTDGVVKLYGGNGGNGGKVGINGSIMSGPWVSIAQSRKDGSAGNKGNNYVGNLVRLCGTLN